MGFNKSMLNLLHITQENKKDGSAHLLGYQNELGGLITLYPASKFRAIL